MPPNPRPTTVPERVARVGAPDRRVATSIQSPGPYHTPAERVNRKGARPAAVPVPLRIGSYGLDEWAVLRVPGHRRNAPGWARFAVDRRAGGCRKRDGIAVAYGGGGPNRHIGHAETRRRDRHGHHVTGASTTGAPGAGHPPPDRPAGPLRAGSAHRRPVGAHAPRRLIRSRTGPISRTFSPNRSPIRIASPVPTGCPPTHNSSGSP